ncbi:MAG: Bug family tripartite tricarboxylate transporter substrate binding protein [Beijerinckiaceae bacterium]
MTIKITRRTAGGIFAGALAMPAIARAQSGQPIKIIVPFPAGGSVDAFGRMTQAGLQQRLGQTVIVENRPGASGALGAAQVAKADPDGNTWLYVFDTHAVNPALQPNMPFDTQKDLEPVMLIGTAPMTIGAHPDKPWKTFQELVAAAKAKPDTISYGSISTGSLGHLAMTLIGKQLGVQWRHAPYRGGGPLTNDVVGGHIDVGIASAAQFASNVAGGKIRPLAQTSLERLPAMKDVPTVAESGVPGFSADAWWGVFAPAKTPAATIEKFRAALDATLREAQTEKQIRENMLINLRAGGPDVLRAFLDKEMKTWGAVVRENGIKAEG